MAQRGEQVTPAGAENFRVPDKASLLASGAVDLVQFPHLHRRRRPGPGTPHRDDPREPSRRERNREGWLLERNALLSPTSGVTAREIRERFGLTHPVVQGDIDAYITEQVAALRASREVDPGALGALFALKRTYEEGRSAMKQDRPDERVDSPVLLRIRRRIERLGQPTSDEQKKRRLPPKATVAHRLHLEGFSLEEIGEALAIAPESAKTYIADVRATELGAEQEKAAREAKIAEAARLYSASMPIGEIATTLAVSPVTARIYLGAAIGRELASRESDEQPEHVPTRRDRGVKTKTTGPAAEREKLYAQEQRTLVNYLAEHPDATTVELAQLLGCGRWTVKERLRQIVAEPPEGTLQSTPGGSTSEVTVFSGTSQGDLLGAADPFHTSDDTPLSEREERRNATAKDTPPRRRRQIK